MPSRLIKQVERSLKVSWREQPTRYDIEALQANIRRVGLVIRVRWSLIVVLVLYSALGALLYATRIPIPELASLMWVPALALGLVVVYNTFYSLNYRRLGNIAYWNNLQLALDAFIVTVLVYFSGGVNSWFWTMYMLFILEATFILPRSRDAWLIAILCIVLLGGVEWLEYFGVLPHADIPFASPGLHEDLVFVAVRFSWQVAVLVGAAWVSNLLVGEFRRELAQARSSQAILDGGTGLFSRGYFMRSLPAELRRANRDGRPVHAIVIDLDRFGDFNARFGLDAGDELLRQIAVSINRVLSDAGDATAGNVVARIGGEEFAVMFVEDDRLSAPPRFEDAWSVAEQIRAAIEATRIEGAGVTASIGLATSPRDGGTGDELLDAADTALSCAVERGGNRVISAHECRTRPTADSVPES